MQKRGFTLVELLVVIAIIAILAAILFPVFLAVRAAAYQVTANSTVREMGEATMLYNGDTDDRYMPAMYIDKTGFQTWFGRRTKRTQPFDGTQGLLFPYEKSQKLKDPTANFKDYLGDHSGYGYNWGYLGSDFHITKNYKSFPNCQNMATSSDLTSPSTTVVLATSVFFSPTWTGGDGQSYDFGFVDPVGFRPSNPNVDFRHLAPRVVDNVGHTIKLPGNALVVFSDGHTKSFKYGSLKDTMFQRGQPK